MTETEMNIICRMDIVAMETFPTRISKSWPTLGSFTVRKTLVSMNTAFGCILELLIRMLRSFLLYVYVGRVPLNCLENTVLLTSSFSISR